MAVHPFPIGGQRQRGNPFERAQLALKGGGGREVVGASPAEPATVKKNNSVLL